MLVREFGPGDTFGSAELIHDVARTTTISSMEHGLVWTLPKKVFDVKLKKAPAPAPSLIARLRAVPFFQALPQGHLVELCRAGVMRKKTLEEGDELFAKGSPARTIYALEDGTVASEPANGEPRAILRASTTARGAERPEGILGAQALFAEESVRLFETSVTACAGKATVLCFDVHDIEALVGYGLQQQIQATYALALLRRVQWRAASSLTAFRTPKPNGWQRRPCASPSSRRGSAWSPKGRSTPSSLSSCVVARPFVRLTWAR